MIALVDWTVTASQWTIGQLAMIYLLTFVVGIGRFAHCGAGSREVGSVVIAGTLPLSAYFHWISPVIWGNICGGVFIVSLLNYGQAKEL
jgi:formate/nitrite transporter FocA (FNT family)